MHKPSPAGFWGDKKAVPSLTIVAIGPVTAAVQTMLKGACACAWKSPAVICRKKYEVPLTKFAFLKDEKSTKATRLFN